MDSAGFQNEHIYHPKQNKFYVFLPYVSHGRKRENNIHWGITPMWESLKSLDIHFILFLAKTRCTFYSHLLNRVKLSIHNKKKILLKLYNNSAGNRVANKLQCFLAWFQQANLEPQLSMWCLSKEMQFRSFWKIQDSRQ